MDGNYAILIGIIILLANFVWGYIDNLYPQYYKHWKYIFLFTLGVILLVISGIILGIAFTNITEQYLLMGILFWCYGFTFYGLGYKELIRLKTLDNIAEEHEIKQVKKLNGFMWLLYFCDIGILGMILAF